MSDTEQSNKGSGWTEREKMVYLLGLLEASTTDTKINYADAPRPPGRTDGACKIMVHRLRQSLKEELEAMKAGQSLDTVVKPPKTPSKRKTAPKGDGEGGEGTPKKRGRPEKVAENKEVEAEAEETKKGVGTPGDVKEKKKGGRPKKAAAEKAEDKVKEEVKKEVKEEAESEVEGGEDDE
ncbi:hypothetical protein M011DRAFT_489452 [Sporormia fimetaria CBS 119925]|uniref:Uncharacterized protein n=1 Tax=Sporormia fimetaria CBS 119925 TaxID=1340428 RepID=A0A6A6V077_9PLEO|nr:hypothetical protein M011DRAFT_489452 [Sporormia fimetaria CBS 119925]